MVSELLSFALELSDEEMVLRWYQDARISDWERDYKGDAIANLLQLRHPDVAIDIWKKKARKIMERCNAPEYPTACNYLRKIKLTMSEAAWKEYKGWLLNEYRKRRAFLPLLAKMDEEDLPY